MSALSTRHPRILSRCSSRREPTNLRAPHASCPMPPDILPLSLKSLGKASGTENIFQTTCHFPFHGTEISASILRKRTNQPVVCGPIRPQPLGKASGNGCVAQISCHFPIHGVRGSVNQTPSHPSPEASGHQGPQPPGVQNIEASQHQSTQTSRHPGTKTSKRSNIRTPGQPSAKTPRPQSA